MTSPVRPDGSGPVAEPGAGSAGTFRSLRHRNFRLFFVGQGISQVGNWLTLVAQSLLAYHLVGTSLAIGVLSACQFLPVLLLGAYAGVVADRMDKRRLLLVVQTLAMVQSFALAYVAAVGASVVWLDVVALFGGLSMAFDNPARRSLFVELVDEADVNNAVGLNSSLMTFSRILGPLCAGLLIHSAGYAWCFGADGISYVAVLVALLMMDPTTMRRSPVVERARGQVRDGFRYARRTNEIWTPLVMMAVVGTLAFNFTVVFPRFVSGTFGAQEVVFTWLFSVLSVGSFVGALIAARRRDVGVRDVASASIAFGITMTVLSWSPSLFVAFPLALAVGFASITFLTTSTAIVQLRADPSMRGRVLALQAIVFLGTTPIGGPIVGAVSDHFGPRVGVLLGGIAALGAGLWGRWRATTPVT